MSKKNKVTAITVAAREASLAGRRVLAMQKEAAAVDKEETDRRSRSLQLVSSKEGLSALIRCGRVTVQIEGDEFAVSSHN